MNGLEFLERRRSENLHPHIPVVLVTTEDSAEDEGRGRAAGAWEYLPQAFTPGPTQPSWWSGPRARGVRT